MPKKLYKCLPIPLIILLFLSFTFFFVGCGKKKDTPQTPAPTPEVPPSFADAIPNSPVFDNLATFIKNNTTDTTNTLEGYDNAYNISSNPVQNELHVYDIFYSTTQNKLAVVCDEFHIGHLFFTKAADEDYATTSTTMTGTVTLMIPTNNYLGTGVGSYEYIFQFAITIPPVQFVDMQTTCTLPEFDNITKRRSNTSDSNATKLEATAEDKILVKQKLIVAYQNYLQALNQLYIEKIQNNDTRYNGAVFKYFYLPVMLKI